MSAGLSYFEAETAAENQTELRSRLNGTDDGRSKREKQFGARVRLESLTYSASALSG